jgi:glycosyltransferase involved in cell wall biosynthesis
MAEWGVSEDRMSILSNAVDGDEFRSLREPDGRVGRFLLTVARLESSEGYKGVEKVLGALPRIHEHFPDIRYHIVGTGSDLPRLEALARKLGVRACVDFAGSISNEALLRAYNDCDLFVLLSLGEGFGFVFLEALACGTPIVAANRAGSLEPLLGGRLGRLVDPDDHAGVAGTILEGLRCSGDRKVSGNVLRAEVLAAYGYDAFRARVLEVLRSALDETSVSDQRE